MDSYFVPLLILALVMSAAIATLLGIYSWRHRDVPGAGPFVLAMICVIVWALAAALETPALDLPTKLFWFKVKFLVVPFLPLIILLTVLQYLGRDQWLRWQRVVPLAIVPGLAAMLFWTNELHGWMWRDIHLDTSGASAVISRTQGPAFLIYVAYSYILSIGIPALLLHALWNKPSIYRGQTLTMLIGIAIPLTGDILYQLGSGPWRGYDLAPFTFGLSGILLAWGLFRYRLFDVMPVARDALIESMSAGMLVLDAQNRLVDLNPAARRILGALPPQVIGQPAERILHLWPALLTLCQEQTATQEEIVVGEGKTRRYYDLQMSPLNNRRGQFTGRLVLWYDITARKEAEAALQALAEWNQSIVNIVSHDLRNPIGRVKGYSEMLLDSKHSTMSEEERDKIRRILRASKQQESLITDLLDRAQLEAGTFVLRVATFAPAHLLDDLREAMQSKAQAKGLQFETQLAPDAPPFLQGDPQRLHQILNNLVANAIKFTEKGVITVRVYCPDPAHWALAVADTGCGIPAEAQARVFEPYQQLDGGVKAQGVGLGLSIVKELVKAMGGELKLDSMVGRGSTFTVILPLADSSSIPSGFLDLTDTAGNSSREASTI